MDSCDVLIVGGGPAGSSCAWALRNSGLRIVLIDKSSFPRDKICGGWVTPAVFNLLEIDPKEYSRGHTLQAIHGFRLGSLGQRPVEVSYDHAISYGIRRCEFDDYLVRRSNARMRGGTAIQKIEKSGAGWIVNGEIETKLLIGAGGHFCPVARSLMREEKNPQPVVAQEVEFAMSEEQASSCQIKPDVPELFFCKDMKGYGWCFRKGNYLNLGLGRLDQHGLPEHVGHFLDLLRRADRIGFDLPAHPLGHAYLLYGDSSRRLVGDGVLLIGDSAGLAYAVSGEGILPAIESGILAARVILSAGGRYDVEQLRRYELLLTEKLKPQESRLTQAARSIPTAMEEVLFRALLRNKYFCRKVILEQMFLHGEHSSQRQLNAAQSA